MWRTRALLFGSLAALVLIAGVAQAGNGGRHLSTTLTGAAEVPGPGDPDATGSADLRLNQGRERICFDIEWADVDGTVLAGHIHVGEATEAGPIVVTLFEGSFTGTDAVSGCVEDVERSLVKAIRKDPADYYVNVHSTPGFEGGAVRGQLAR